MKKIFLSLLMALPLGAFAGEALPIPPDGFFFQYSGDAHFTPNGEHGFSLNCSPNPDRLCYTITIKKHQISIDFNIGPTSVQWSGAPSLTHINGVPADLIDANFAPTQFLQVTTGQ